MPLVYYLYKGGNLKTKEAKQEARKFLSISMAKRLFSGSSNDTIRNTRNALKSYDCKNNPFTVSIFYQITLTGNRTFKVTENDIDYWLDHYTIGESTYTILSLLYPDLKLNQVSFHQDHCHPYASFDTRSLKNLGIAEDKIADWQIKRNLLPNLQFLKGSENESKNKTSLNKWIQDGHTIKFMPKDISLELKDFDTFFSERRKLAKAELLSIFGLA